MHYPKKHVFRVAHELFFHCRAPFWEKSLPELPPSPLFSDFPERLSHLPKSTVPGVERLRAGFTVRALVRIRTSEPVLYNKSTGGVRTVPVEAPTVRTC